MEERYFVIREDKERKYGSDWFRLMAYPNSLKGATDFCEEYARKEPRCNFMIAKLIMYADTNVQIEMKEI